MGIATIIESLLNNTPASIITEIFCIIIIVSLGTSFYLILKNKGSLHVSYTPAFLTSLGVLGTFTGIVVGLLAFDSADIDGSIPNLLEGLKTAFITSLVGLFSSLLFKVVQSTGKLQNNTHHSANEEGKSGRVLLRPQQYNIAASVDYFVTAVYITKFRNKFRTD